jgi:isoleucyl-tRNA synthetase
VLGEGWARGEPFDGRTLVGTRYEPPYPNVEGAHTVVAADFVSMDDGTGIVHLAPAFGPDDLEESRRQGWPVWRPVADDGTFTDDAPAFVRGVFVKDADPAIVEELRSRDRVFDVGVYEHAYPFCWRCHTPLLYFARTSWYIRTTAVKDRLLAVQRHRSTGTRTTSRRPVRQLAREQHRLGDLARAVLGHAVADLAMRGRSRHRGRLAHRGSPIWPAAM